MKKNKVPHWRRHIDKLNGAVDKLIEIGALDETPRLQAPTGVIAAISTRIEEQLLYIGIPAEVHVSVIQIMAGRAQIKMLTEDTTLMEKILDSDSAEETTAKLSSLVYAKILRNLGVEMTVQEIENLGADSAAFFKKYSTDLMRSWGVEDEDD